MPIWSTVSGTNGRLLEWTDDLRLNVPLIDDQHREIFERLARFREAEAEARGKAEVAGALLFLVDYVAEHFAAEEQLMQECEYPHAARHKAEHVAFRMMLRDFVTCYSWSGASTLLKLQIEHRWESWLINHIKQGDRELARFLRGRGLRAGVGSSPSAPRGEVPAGSRRASEEHEQGGDAQRDEPRGGHEDD